MVERCCYCFYANNKIPPTSMTGMPIKHPIPDKLVRMPKNMRTNPVALRAGFQLMAIIMAIIMATVIDSIKKAKSVHYAQSSAFFIIVAIHILKLTNLHSQHTKPIFNILPISVIKEFG